MEFIMTLMVLSGLNVTHASHPTTLPAQKTPHQSVNTLAHLWNVKNTNFLFTFYFLFFCFKMPGGGKKQTLKCKKDRKGDAGCKRGSSHKGGDLNNWKESDMQNAWDEYKE